MFIDSWNWDQLVVVDHAGRLQNGAAARAAAHRAHAGVATNVPQLRVTEGHEVLTGQRAYDFLLRKGVQIRVATASRLAAATAGGGLAPVPQADMNSADDVVGESINGRPAEWRLWKNAISETLRCLQLQPTLRYETRRAFWRLVQSGDPARFLDNLARVVQSAGVLQELAAAVPTGPGRIDIEQFNGLALAGEPTVSLVQYVPVNGADGRATVKRALAPDPQGRRTEFGYEFTWKSVQDIGFVRLDRSVLDRTHVRDPRTAGVPEADAVQQSNEELHRRALRDMGLNLSTHQPLRMLVDFTTSRIQGVGGSFILSASRRRRTRTGCMFSGTWI